MFFGRIPATLGIAGLLCLPATAARAADPSERDVAFLRAAHQTNLAEIAAGRIAWRKATDPDLKSLAASFMRDHIWMDGEVGSVARKLRVALPSSPTEEQRAMVHRYEVAEAGAFDEFYLTSQLAGHREALALITAEADQGTETSVKELAAKAAPVVSGHVQQLRSVAASEGLAGYLEAGGRTH
ncbi:DUF4142 domain-containing protein [Actinoplanes oblitus]|uniref:DUF4142 domain-containing protein n=1 Tax=Actinoplanes oblitus TaxID=3040509 RepID=A0ABY8WEL7_9ACTN|nr:DUF4142 domain-containing protein [Actinoplanes oblitus]WIM94933.1 DUF4142 domain-containing protein [Actinoplanes oblitus]